MILNKANIVKCLHWYDKNTYFVDFCYQGTKKVGYKIVFYETLKQGLDGLSSEFEIAKINTVGTRTIIILYKVQNNKRKDLDMYNNEDIARMLRIRRVGWIEKKKPKQKEKIWGERDNNKTFSPPHKKGGK